MKRIISLCLMGLMLLTAIFSFCACKSGKPNVAAQTTQPTDPPSQAELKKMEDEGYACWKAAKFKDGINIFRQLNKYGYISAYDLEGRERLYDIYAIQCRLCEFVIRKLRQELKDPQSLVLYGFKIEADKTDTVKVVLDYGAKNGFGGMERDEYVYPVTLFKGDLEKTLKYAEYYHPTETFYLDDMADYFAGCAEFFGQEAYDAVVNGTCNY